MTKIRSLCLAVLIAGAASGGASAQLLGGEGGVLGSVGGILGGGSGGGVLGGGGTGGGLLGGGGAGGGLLGTGVGGGENGAVGGVHKLGRATRIVSGQSGSNSVVRRITREDVLQVLVTRLKRLETDDWLHNAPAPTLNEIRQLRLQQLVADNRATLDMDPKGNPVIKGKVIALDPSARNLAVAKRAGFTVLTDERDLVLGIRTVALSTPRGLSTAKAAAALRAAAPQMIVELDHVFEPAAGGLAASSIALAAASSAAAGGGPLIGMIDGGVAESPALANAAIEQRGFAGAAEASGHGTAVASLIVGQNGKFRGAAPHANLIVADVYGGNPAAGSASAIMKAMSWMASRRPSVVNVSLVGPRNRLVERAVAAALARGIKVVAAVGNDGPAAPALYPASQPGVIAVTGVCKENRALAEAGRALHLDYAGPGADMAAALPGKGYANVRGTSFAAPFVTARLALTGSTAQLDSEARKGHGRIGRGVVCHSCRIAPKTVGVK